MDPRITANDTSTSTAATATVVTGTTPVPPVAFVFTPYLLYTNDILDFDFKLGRDIFIRSISSLKNFFDGDSKHIDLL